MKTAIKKSRSGFTLIELMITVAIIGLLAMIALPRFENYRKKAKQSEAKINLKAIYTQELTFFAEASRYTELLSELGWKPQGICLYEYSVGADTAGNPTPGGPPSGNHPAFANQTAFNAVAWGNLDSDPIIDTWEISKDYTLRNTSDDSTD